MNVAQQVVEAERHAPASEWSPPVVSESAAMINMIARASRDPAVDIDKFERLMKMYTQAQERQAAEAALAARRLFNEAMVAAQAEIPQVVKNAENTQTHSFYATIDAIGAAIDPIIHKHGFFQSFASADCPIEGCYRVVCTTAHVGGHEKVDYLDVPIDGAGFKGTANKTATHALASTISYGRRIITMLVFNVKSRKALPDDDGNRAGRSVQSITQDQADNLRLLIEDVGANLPIFLKYYKIERVEDLPASLLAKATANLESKRAKT